MIPSTTIATSNQVQAENVTIAKDMYQHAIPRFILRQFGIAPDPLSPQVPGQQHVWTTGKKPASVYLYQVSTGRLIVKGLGSVYGQINLYRDLKESQDVDYLEHKLAYLENSTSLVIKAIHVGIPSGSVLLSRAELATLRKFIFLMDYRSVANSASYFHEDNSLNVPLAELIMKYKQTHELQSVKDVWQAGLKFFLDTPHHEIVAAGESLRNRYGCHQPYGFPWKRFDPDIEEWFAIDYESQANYLFLGVWVAAEGNEFILSENSYSLWEGIISGSPGAHKLCVVSPRIALVLRRTCFHNPHPNDPLIANSAIINVPISPPKFTCALKDVDPDDPPKIAMNVYRLTPKAQEDCFLFQYTKLSAQETYSVNEVILLNANTEHNGSITFSSCKAMINTLESFIPPRHRDTNFDGKRKLFQPLLTELHRMKTKPKKPIPPSLKSQKLPSEASDACADHPFSLFIRSLSLKRMQFSSAYTRAYLVYHMATSTYSSNPLSLQIRRISDDAIAKLQFLLNRPLHSSSSSLPTTCTPTRSRKLVESLSKAESDIFFVVVKHLVDPVQVGGHSKDRVAEIIYEASMIGVTYWLMESREDILLDLLGLRVNIFA